MQGTIEKRETRPLLTVEEAAARLRLSRPTMYRLIAAELVPAFRVGGSIRIDADELEEWLTGSAVGSSSANSAVGGSSVDAPVERDGTSRREAVEPAQLAGGER
jgi:excisionase family DNA binding protein